MLTAQKDFDVMSNLKPVSNNSLGIEGIEGVKAEWRLLKLSGMTIFFDFFARQGSRFD